MGFDARTLFWTVFGYALVLGSLPLIIFAPFGTIFAVSALVGLLGCAKALEGLGARGWRTLPGRIVRSERVARVSVADGMENERAEIEYVYEIDGRAYRGTRVSALAADTEPRGLTERRLERYPLGASVRVYARRQDPSVAVLEPGVPAAAWLLMGAWIFAGVAAWHWVERYGAEPRRGWLDLVPLALLILVPTVSRFDQRRRKS